MCFLMNMEELFLKHEYLIHSTIKRNFSSPSYRHAHMLDMDELYQFGRIGLYEACLDYDSLRGKSFRNYAIDKIIWKVQDESKKNSLRNVNYSSNELLDIISFNSVLNGDDGEDVELQENVSDDSDFIGDLLVKLSIKQVTKKLPSKVYDILALRMQNFTFEEIATELGISRQYAQQLLGKHKNSIIELLELREEYV